MTVDTLTKDESIRLMQAEIERLRDVIDRAAQAWLSLDPPVQWEGDAGDAMVAAVADIERLRGLLREAHLALSFMPDPTRKLLDLRYRVREALGE